MAGTQPAHGEKWRYWSDNPIRNQSAKSAQRIVSATVHRNDPTCDDQRRHIASERSIIFRTIELNDGLRSQGAFEDSSNDAVARTELGSTHDAMTS
jgi:hypothetical protein